MCPFIKIFAYNIPSYGLCMCFAIFLCSFLIVKDAQKSSIEFENTIVLIAVITGAFLLSGGLLYILVTYSFEDLITYIRNLDFSFLISGGLVFYGGLLGGVFGGIVCSKILRIEISVVERCIVPYIPLGHAIGRIGCLLAGCCHGFAYNGFLAVRRTLYSQVNTYFPIQVIEAILDILIFIVLLLYAKKEHKKYDILCAYLIIYSIVRFFLEFFRGDEIRGAISCFSTSQWISIAIILFCVLSRRIKYVKGRPHNT